MESLYVIIAAVAGVVVGATILFVAVKPRIATAELTASENSKKAETADIARQKLEVEVATTKVEAGRVSDLVSTLSEREAAITTLKQTLAAQEATMSEREQALREEREQLSKLKDEFKAQFAELSKNALKDNSEQFLQTAKRELVIQRKDAEEDLQKRKEEISNLVKPIQDGIKAVSEATKEMENKREKAFGTIEEQLKQTVQQTVEVAKQTSGLKDALKRPNVRGRWGEVQLRNCVELAGMEDHCDVEFQESSMSPDEDRIRPDMIVRMPGGRKITVDAKTPMDYFLQHIDAATDEDRNAALVNHGRAVRSHVAALAKTDYMQKVAGSPDFVVMFLPNESFLAMALEREPTLLEEALTKKVLITTPGTLIGLLKVVRYGWTEQKIAENAQRIADEGAKLNTEINRFLEEYAKLGKAIKQASDLYDTSSRRVEKQITNSSQRLTALGAKSRKALSTTAVRMLAPGDNDNILLEVDLMETESVLVEET